MGAEGEEHGMSVRRRACRLCGPKIAAGASDVFDEELLAQLLGQFLGREPREDVGGAARRERDDHPHRPRWIGLGPSDPGKYGSPSRELQKPAPMKFDSTHRLTRKWVATYSALMFAALMIGHHFSISAF